MAGDTTKRVLVTRSTGFLGRHALAALTARDDIDPIAACRTPDRLDRGFTGEIRVGDLRDARYRREVVQDVDVVCHAGTWASMWGHHDEERTHFLEPALDLIEQAIGAGVGRLVMASTVAIATPATDGGALDDFSETAKSGFWPHLDALIELDAYMRDNSHRGTGMVTMRLGHFVGAGNRIGIIGALTARLRTRLVPWIAQGRSRLPLVADTDLGRALALSAVAEGLDDYESFNICGPDFPTAREVIGFIAAETGFPTPWFSVPHRAAHGFGWLMEQARFVRPAGAPFLTRSLVHLARDWFCPGDYAAEKLGYVPTKDWRIAAREALTELQESGYPWPRLAQAA